MVALPRAVAQGSERSIAAIWPAIVGCTLASVVAVTVLVVSTGLAPTPPVEVGRPLALRSPVLAGVIVLVAACWLLVEDHPGSAIGLSLVSAAWLLPALAAWPLPSAQVRAALLAAAPLAVAGIVLVTAGWQPGGLGRRSGLMLLSVGLAIAAAGAHLIGYNPFFDPACGSTCEASPAVLSNALGPRQALAVSAALTLVAAIAAVATILQSGGAPRSVRAAGVVAATLVAAAAIEQWWQWGRAGTPATADRLQSLGTAVIVAAALVAVLHTRRVRRNVRHVAQDLAGSVPVGAAAGSVTAVHFAMPYDRRWVDADGHEVSTETPERCATLSDANGPSVRLILSRWAEAGQILSSITPADRLALENARLLAADLARVADVQASQRRIVEATDRQRRRIERDLHDGAQQRLVAVTMHLSSGRIRSHGVVSSELAAGEAHLVAALASLRALSHDSLAAVLGTEGLEVAVEDLVAAVPRADLQMDLTERLPPAPVQTAAYMTVVAGLSNVVAHAGGADVRVTLVRDGDELTVQVADDGPGGAVIGPGLTDVADRVGALGGRLDLASNPGAGTNLLVRLPCG